MERTPWTTGTAGVIAALGMLGFALFPLAIPFVLLTAVFTAPLLLVGVAAAVPLGVVAVLVMAIRATARRIERRDGDSHQKRVRARPRTQHRLPPPPPPSG